MPVFLLLLLVPLIEIALFVTVGGAIGLWPTLACVVVTAILGAALWRTQGLKTLRRLQEALGRGEDPSGPLAHGALMLLAGALLLTPGFFTDAVGLSLTAPAVRQKLIETLGPRLRARVVVAAGGRPRPPPPGGDTPIEADYRDVTDEPQRR